MIYSRHDSCLSCLAEVRLRQGRAEKKIGPASRSRGNPFKEPLINLRIMAHCAFDSRAGREIGARVIEHVARIRVQLPTVCPHAALFRCVALGGAKVPLPPIAAVRKG